MFVVPDDTDEGTSIAYQRHHTTPCRSIMIPCMRNMSYIELEESLAQANSLETQQVIDDWSAKLLPRQSGMQGQRQSGLPMPLPVTNQNVQAFFEPPMFDESMIEAMTEEIGNVQGSGVLDSASEPFPPLPPPRMQIGDVTDISQNIDPWYPFVAPPSVASMQSSTDIVTALVDGQVRERQQVCASRKELKGMNYPTFCKTINGMHLIDIFGLHIQQRSVTVSYFCRDGLRRWHAWIGICLARAH